MLYIICFLSLITAYIIADKISNLLVRKVNNDYEKLRIKKADTTIKWVRWSRRDKVNGSSNERK